ncbi:MAG: DOMON-like domain-containing protein [Xanthobacteraceae bacterium]
MRRPLKLHPHSVCNVAAGIEVEVARPAGGSLFLSYTVTGAIGDLLLPPIAAPSRTDELWRHTCFEAFVTDAASEAYYEFNLAPSTQWAAYRFDRYRSGMHAATEIEPPQIVGRSLPDHYTLRAALSLPDRQRDRTLRVGLAAVIEERNGNTSYWALVHPPGAPDFHHADGFALELSKG